MVLVGQLPCSLALWTLMIVPRATRQ
jgi:hypothetical protein